MTMQAWLARIRDLLTRPASGPADEGGAPRIQSRPVMDRALKAIFVPALRARGFTGSLPHFRRIRSDRIDLVTVQHSRYGGEFVVELAQCGPDGVTAGQGKEAPPDKVTAHHLFSPRRYRLSHRPGGRGQWFAFDDDRGPAPTEAALEDACAKAAKMALDAFARQAEPWWERKAAAGRNARG
jgi:Domain of unknown function (DUF4304)